MYAIMGASGNTGGVAAAELLARGLPVRALSRTPAKTRADLAVTEAAAVDLRDLGSLIRGFEGAEAAYVMIPPLVTATDFRSAARAAAEAIAEAVRRSGIGRIVALSSAGAHLSHGTGAILSLHDFEVALRQTDAAVTFIRPGDFMENWAPLLPLAAADGILPSVRLPLEAPMQTVSAVDVGRCAATCLAGGQPGDRVVNLLGPRDYSPQDVANALGQVLGRPVRVVPMPADQVVPALVEQGVGESYARGVAEIYDGLNRNRIGFEAGVGEDRRGSVDLVGAFQCMADKVGLPIAS